MANFQLVSPPGLLGLAGQTAVGAVVVDRGKEVESVGLRKRAEEAQSRATSAGGSPHRRNSATKRRVQVRNLTVTLCLKGRELSFSGIQNHM